MKPLWRSIFLLLLVAFLLGFQSSSGWAEETKIANDEMNLVDLFIARPLGIIAAAGGTCLFIVSLPFTLPTKSTGDAFNMFVVEPWKFSCVREFPDESIY
ncbi:MAG: hypothetical protein ACUVWO_09005 [Thermodesulfobacteriota bacterium]